MNWFAAVVMCFQVGQMNWCVGAHDDRAVTGYADQAQCEARLVEMEDDIRRLPIPGKELTEFEGFCEHGVEDAKLRMLWIREMITSGAWWKRNEGEPA